GVRAGGGGDWFQPDSLFELVQAIPRFSGNGFANGGGNGIDSLVQPFRFIETSQEVFEMGAIDPSKLLNRHHALQQSIRADPRPPNTALLLLGLRADPEISPRGVEIPGDKAELVRSRVKVQVKVLSRRQDAVIVWKKNLDGEKPRELVQIQKTFDLLCEFLVAGRRHQVRKFDDALALFRGCFRFQIVNRRIGRPVLAHVAEQLVATRLEQRRLSGSKSL